MKKVILSLLLIVGMQQLKAQQLLMAKPDIKLTDSLNNYFKPQTYSPLQLLSAQPNINLFEVDEGNAVVDNHMPIAKLQSNDHMPVVKLGEDGVKYTMLIKKVQSVPPVDVVPVPAS